MSSGISPARSLFNGYNWLVLAVMLLFAAGFVDKSAANLSTFALVLLAGGVGIARWREFGPGDRAARIWLVCAFVAVAILLIAAWAWNDRLLYPLRVGRVLPAAFAAWLLAGVGADWSSSRLRHWTFWALALGCLAAFAETYVNGRHTTTNPIPWAVVAGMCVAALAPRVMDFGHGHAERVAWCLCCIAGMTGVALSLSRGAFGIWLWVPGVWLLLAFSASVRRRFLVAAGGLVLVLGVAAIAVVYHFGSETHRIDRHESVGDRLRSAVSEVKDAISAGPGSDVANTSIGARVVLWQIAGQAFAEAPLTGVGIVGLHARIQAEADRLNSDVLRYASDQAHNEYLQMAAAYGIVGLGANVLLLAGLLIAARLLRRRDLHAAWQLGGVAFMHATGGLTNVNFSQNFYGIGMGLIVAFILLSARREPAGGEL